jgi:antitoxin component YwqK of YwqJK toxin-antitoxin module
MKLKLIFTFLIIHSSLFCQNSAVKYYNADETTIDLFDSITYLRSDMSPITGVIKKFDENRKLVLECNFTNGLKDGALRHWCSNGVLVFSGTYKLGIPEGVFQWWYSNGKPKAKCTYLNGQLHGKSEEWYLENGQLKFEENYQNGKMIGVQRYYRNTGVYAGGGNLKEGNGKLVFYFDSLNRNKIAIEADYGNGVLEGQVKYFTTKGELKELNNFTMGQLNGLQQFWENGKLKEERNYKSGKVNGTRKRWSADGLFLVEEEWENSELLNSKCWNEKLELIEKPENMIIGDPWGDWFEIEMAIAKQESLRSQENNIIGFQSYSDFLNINQWSGEWCYEIEIEKQTTHEILDPYGGFLYCTFE